MIKQQVKIKHLPSHLEGLTIGGQNETEINRYLYYVGGMVSCASNRGCIGYR